MGLGHRRGGPIVTSFVIAACASLGGAGAASAGVLLDPGSFGFTGLTALSAPASGTHTLSFNTGTGAVTLDGASIRPAGTGVQNGIGEVTNAGGTGLTAFVVSSFTAPSGTTVTYTGTAPLALLSTGAITIGGTVTSGPAPAGGTGVGSAASTGIGGGGGGGFGGAGGAGGKPGGAGGVANGSAAFVTASMFPTGSSGGPGLACSDGPGMPGGAGGGGIELAALGQIDLTDGSLLAEGATAEAAPPNSASTSTGGGGGSGGAVLIATPKYVDTAATTLGLFGAPGGAAGTCGNASLTPGNGGGGGGGRLELVSDQSSAASASVAPSPPTYRSGSINGDAGSAGTSDRQPFVTLSGPASGAVDVGVTFTGAPAIGSFAGTSWSFGDGSAPSTQGTHTFGMPGIYRVTLTGTMAGSGVVTTTTTTITVTDTLSKLLITPANATAIQGQGVTFTANGYDANGAPVGDRTAQTTFTISPSLGNSAFCSGDTCIAEGTGTYTITGTDGMATGETTLIVASSGVPPIQSSTPSITLRCSHAQAGHHAVYMQAGVAVQCDVHVGAGAPGTVRLLAPHAQPSHCALPTSGANEGRCSFSFTPTQGGLVVVEADYEGQAPTFLPSTVYENLGFWDNHFSLGAPVQDHTHGTATIEVRLRDRGELQVTGPHIISVDRQISGPGSTTVTIVATGSAAHALAPQGGVRVGVSFRFIPHKAHNHPRTVTRTVHLIKIVQPNHHPGHP